MDVYHEILPDRYVLLLADSASPATNSSAHTLARCLMQACRSGKTSVWIDCSRLHHLPTTARDLLLRYQQRLSQRSIRLVLSRACDTVRLAFADVDPARRPEMAGEEPA